MIYLRTIPSLSVLILVSLAVVLCRPTDELRSKRNAPEERQLLGGLTTLGTLVQPILFMIGVANFMGRIPTFFNRVRDRLSLGLGGTGATAGAGRKRRSLKDPWSDQLIQDGVEALRLLGEAMDKYQKQR